MRSVACAKPSMELTEAVAEAARNDRRESLDMARYSLLWQGGACPTVSPFAVPMSDGIPWSQRPSTIGRHRPAPILGRTRAHFKRESRPFYREQKRYRTARRTRSDPSPILRPRSAPALSLPNGAGFDAATRRRSVEIRISHNRLMSPHLATMVILGALDVRAARTITLRVLSTSCPRPEPSSLCGCPETEV